MKNIPKLEFGSSPKGDPQVRIAYEQEIGVWHQTLETIHVELVEKISDQKITLYECFEIVREAYDYFDEEAVVEVATPKSRLLSESRLSRLFLSAYAAEKEHNIYAPELCIRKNIAEFRDRIGDREFFIAGPNVYSQSFTTEGEGMLLATLLRISGRISLLEEAMINKMIEDHEDIL